MKLNLGNARAYIPGGLLAVGLGVACLVVPLATTGTGTGTLQQGVDPNGLPLATGSAGGDGARPAGSGAPAVGTTGGAVGATTGAADGGTVGGAITGPAGGVPTGPGDPFANSYQGVSATKVKWGSAAALNSCGAFDQGAVARSFGIESNDPLSYEVATEYFNKYPLTDFPLPPDIRKGVNAKNGYWGRRLERILKDSGGYACQDVGRANAVAMAEKDKVFGLIMPNNDGPEVPMSLVMAQHKLIHIGRWLTGPLFWKQRAPYFYDGVHGDGVRENIALGSWVCRDWKGGKAHNTGDPKVTGMPRKFGILFPDDPQFREVAGFLDKELASCGMSVPKYAIPFDLATLEAQAQSTVNRMVRDGVTTILSVNDFLTRLLTSKSATNQGWHPEWVLSGWGIGSHPGAYNTFFEPTQAANAWAAADAASIHTPAWNKSEPYLAWKKVRPTTEPPDGWNNFYNDFKLLAIGMAGAGRNLNPTTFGQGLALLCKPCPRSDALLPLITVYPGHWTNREGFTLVKWNPNKPNYIDRPDANGQPKQGYFDFIENGKRYGLRITDPDPGIGRR